ncbi:MAG: hypothetical protein HGA27_00235 [Peptococcaceae bacterium]|nr:hypothetical protein [Peptococcaceae bacterium]
MNEKLRLSADWHFIYGDGTEIIHKNLIVQGGLDFLASLFIGERTSSFATYLALGTGTTAPVANNTKLETEGSRKIVSSKTRQGSELRIRTYFLASEINQTWTEFGLFVEGTSVANSGVLFNRIVPTGGITKASNQTLTIEIRLTISAS